MAAPQQHQPKYSPNSPRAGTQDDLREDPERAGEANRKGDHRSHQETSGAESEKSGQDSHGGQ
jgi:hypothetical protein